MSLVFPLLAWYLLLALLTLLAFPLTFSIFPALSDRGYAFNRALGLLLWAFIFWLLSSLGVLNNDPGGLFLALLLLGALSIWTWKSHSQQIKEWWQSNTRLVVMVEALFLVVFVAYALFRALSPAITDTEKPMELAFINAILRSDRMPPLDPWLSGYSISYYYFGYLMVAMLAKLTGLNAGIAFNLGVSTVFAATAVGAYSLVYNLLAQQQETRRTGLYLALLAPLFVLIIGNAEGFLEFLHERGAFWHTNDQGMLVSTFWQDTLDIKDLENPPNLDSQGRRHWWWWRASRVVRDYAYPVLQGITPEQTPEGYYWFRGEAVADQEVIDEFPTFTYYLADLHPHVLAMPFAFLVIVFALNHFLDPGRSGFQVLGFPVHLSRQLTLQGAVIFGGLAFLNTWDFPLYVGLFAAAHMLKRIDQEGWGWARLGEFLTIGLVYGFGGILLYLPFYFGFSSQAGGLLPNLINPTRGVQLWVMFGTLWLPVFALLVYLNRRSDRANVLKALLLAFSVALAFFCLSTLLAWLVVAALPHLSSFNPALSGVGDLLLGAYGGHSLAEVLREGLARRAASLGGLLTLVALIGLSLNVVWPRPQSEEETNPAYAFAGLLVLVGGLLVLFPEFLYLRDQFGTRMNTIFKFYMQAWLLWGAIAAYASALIFSRLKCPIGKTVFRLIFILSVGVGLFYPAYTIAGKITEFNLTENARLELDGTLHDRYLSENDRAAVEWLKGAPIGTLVEAVGGSYTQYARISTHSGQPALLGWPGHESQWRGSNQEMGSRMSDIERLYTTPSWLDAEYILQQYGIRYVYVGQLECATYQVSLVKFEENLPVAFRQGDVVIYEVPPLPDIQSFE
jgi:YYY domain-containing protein